MLPTFHMDHFHFNNIYVKKVVFRDKNTFVKKDLIRLVLDLS